MRAPLQAKPMPRSFMQQIVGRNWTPDADRRSARDELPGDNRSKRNRPKKKAPEDTCLRQLMTFAVQRRS